MDVFSSVVTMDVLLINVIMDATGMITNAFSRGHRHSSNVNLHRKLLTKELDHAALDSRPTPLPAIFGVRERNPEARGGGAGGRGLGEEFCPVNGCSPYSPESYASVELRSAPSSWSSNSGHSGSSEGAQPDDVEAVSDGDYTSQKAEGIGDAGSSQSPGCGSEEADWRLCDSSPSRHDPAPSLCGSSPLSRGSSPDTPPPPQCSSGPPGAAVGAFRDAFASKPMVSALRRHSPFPCRDRRGQNPALHKSTALAAMMD